MSETTRYTVGVRTLCHLTARQGSLDQRFTPAPTALEGIEGHARVAARRGPGHQAEVPVSGHHRHLCVRGRVDGVDPARRRVEEVKTYKGELARQPEHHRHLHWAQLRVYGALMCQAQGWDSVELALVYVDVARGDETVLVEQASASDLVASFEALCQRFLVWADQELAHRQRRDAACAALRFPHPQFRPGQRGLAEAVYRATVSGRTLLAQAPTGIGKTVGTLFPVLKALPGQGIDKVCCLSARTSGRALSLSAMRALGAGPASPWRVLELVARDKACEHPDRACHGDDCPLARGFYDRLPAARLAAVADGWLDQAAVRAHALAHGICPYYLAQDLARWVDVVVGDYNHQFDTSAMLHAMTVENDWRVVLLVDEAHNLVDRARSMYSAALSQQAALDLRASAPPVVRKPLNRLLRAWGAINRVQHSDHQPLPDIPAAWLGALQQVSGALSTFWADEPTHVDPALQGFHLEALQFIRLADGFGDHSLCDLVTEGPSGPKATTRVHIRNVWPAPCLQPRWRAVHSATLFSATLQPPAHHQRLLGLPDDAAVVEVATPFRPEQLQVRVATHLSTRYRDRARSRDGIVALMHRQWTRQPGNYLAFFSSHDYLREVADAFEVRAPDVPVWRQERGMREADQRAFLERFTPEGQGIGFAVLGGVFGEGIDLPGRRLIGAFIATLGLPQLNPVNEAFSERLEQLLGGRGHDHAYLVPGLQKVVQAAGRVIRGPEDTGVLYLLDDRYNRRDVRQLLPAWWQIQIDRAGDTPL